MSNFAKCSHSFEEKKLFIWDCLGSAPSKNCSILYWQSYPERNSDAISIVDLVERNADDLRSRYLKWIYDLGEFKVNGKSVKDHLILSTGFSYWWAGSFAQKFNLLDTSPVNDAIKILALEDYVNQNSIKHIVLVSHNNFMGESIKSFCNVRNIHFEFEKIRIMNSKKTLRQFGLKIMPDPLKVFIYLLRYIVNTFPLYFAKSREGTKEFGEITFFDIFVHLDIQAAMRGIFKSNYWTDLTDLLNKSNIRCNWAHIFYRQRSIPTVKRASKLLEGFNSDNLQNHFLIERPLGPKNLRDIFINYLTLYRSCKKLKGLSQVQIAKSNAHIWPLFEREWKSSLCGISAIDTCIKLILFLQFFRDMPKQRMGIFIAENQPWELVLNHAWRIQGHGLLVGVPHTVVRYWDLRYFYDRRSYFDSNANGLPMPDYLAINGPTAYLNLLENGYPATQLFEVEALRFLYLNDMPLLDTSLNNAGPLRVLVCGDFLEKTNNLMVSWLDYASKMLPLETEYVVKPHPASSLRFEEHLSPNFKISYMPLSDLLLKCDVILTSNTTSASVGAYLSGLDTIQILDGNSFNLSPLRGLDNTIYVKYVQDLVDALNERIQKRKPPSKAKTYFNLDKDLNRWVKLLRLSE
jgi:surface carbohydrate biosynthesis protein (TIGR04326 family)